MNAYQIDLFTKLEALVAKSEVFYRQEFTLDGSIFWIYNYRLSSYTEFLAPGALECRGIMFEVTPTGEAVRLAALPFPKFFNLNENPFTMDLDLSQVDTVELKADGSLMSTYLHNNQLRLKSKGSLFSEQALDAMKWLDQNPGFKAALATATDCGWTVNLEWCAPQNRIVIGYQQPHLKVLNARYTRNGEYQTRPYLEIIFGEHVIERVNTKGIDVPSFVLGIAAMQDDIEGYVCRIGDLWFKVKTEKYISLHHAKDSINNPRRLFEAIIDEGVDDLRSMFAHDALAIKQIDEMEARVVAMYNHIVNLVQTYYDTYKATDRKAYAIGAQHLEFNNLKLLGLAMSMYLGKDPEFKSWIKSRYKELGFKDTSVVAPTE